MLSFYLPLCNKPIFACLRSVSGILGLSIETDFYGFRESIVFRGVFRYGEACTTFAEDFKDGHMCTIVKGVNKK